MSRRPEGVPARDWNHYHGDALERLACAEPGCNEPCYGREQRCPEHRAQRHRESMPSIRARWRERNRQKLLTRRRA